jgi:hypothetical protein
MKKLLFALLFMTTVSLSFCKKKECESKSGTETQTIAYTETDASTAFKGQNTLTFSNTFNFTSAIGTECINGGKGGCFSKSFSVLNLTNKKVMIKIFGSESEATLNQSPKIVLECPPNGLSKISDGGLAFLSNPCSVDLTKIVRVSYQ